MKDYTFKEFEKKILNSGYVFYRSKGTHKSYKKDGVPKILTLSHHKNINPCIARRLIKEHNLPI